MVRGMDFLKGQVIHSSFSCEGCINRKQQRLLFSIYVATHSAKAVEIVHLDVCGPMKAISMGATKCFITFIDDFKKKILPYPMTRKSEYFDKFKKFKVLVEKQSELKINVFRLDNDGKFMSKKF